MTILQDPPTETERMQDNALFKEARRRRRKRWTLAIGSTVVLLVSLAFAIGAMAQGGHPRSAQRQIPEPPSHEPAPPAQSSLTTALLKSPEALAMAPNGGVLIDEQSSNRIVERKPDGRLVVIAGTGQRGFSGDGGPARSATLDEPVALAVSHSGTIYVADLGNDRIRSISRSGTITTIAGLTQPVALAVGPTGTLFVVDREGVQTVGAHGALRTVIPAAAGPAQDPTVDGSKFAVHPDAVAVTSSGDIYVANASPKVVLRYAPSGSPTIVGQPAWNAGGLYVTRAGLVNAPNGTVLVGDYGGFAVDRLSGSKTRTVISFGRDSVPGLAGVFRPSGITVAPNGVIYAVTDGQNGGTNTPALISIDLNGHARLLDTGLPTVGH